MSNIELLKQLKNFLLPSFPEIKICVEEYKKNPKIKAICFIDENFKNLYPYQRKHYLENNIPKLFFENSLKNSLCIGLTPEENLEDLKYPNEKLINDIKPLILSVLNRVNFFNLMEYLMCPKKSFGEPKKCRGDFSISKSILEGLDFNKKEIFDILHVLMFQGCYCDCEILCKFLNRENFSERCLKNKNSADRNRS